MPAHLQFENGGESVALIPTRYPGSEAAADGPIALARKTVWQEIAPGTHHGLGQRIIATDAGDVPLMEIRTLSITQEATPTTEPLAADHG
jgi:type VI secretion system protein ImpE